MPIVLAMLLIAFVSVGIRVAGKREYRVYTRAISHEQNSDTQDMRVVR